MDDREILKKIIETGISSHDAKVIADCIITRRSCSWVNTDPVTRDAVKKLLTFNEEGGFGILFSIKEVATRGKYIWEVKVPQH